MADPRLRIPACLAGVGRAMGRCSTQYYADVIGLRSTAAVCRTNSAAAARRVQELIADCAKEALQSIDGTFAGQLVAPAVEGVPSGVLLSGGPTVGEAYFEMADLLLRGLSAP